MDPLSILLSLAGTIAAAALLRIGFLLGRRRPTVARVCGSDLTEAERLHDRDMHLAALVDGRPSWDDNHLKQVTVRVSYAVDGIERRADLTVYPHRGDRPDDTMVLWYDPDNPQRVTTSGLGLPMLALLGAIVLAIAGLRSF